MLLSMVEKGGGAKRQEILTYLGDFKVPDCLSVVLKGEVTLPLGL